jgi:hypothetical protein
VSALILLGNNELPVFRDLEQARVIRQVRLRAGGNCREERLGIVTARNIAASFSVKGGVTAISPL